MPLYIELVINENNLLTLNAMNSQVSRLFNSFLDYKNIIFDIVRTVGMYKIRKEQVSRLPQTIDSVERNKQLSNEPAIVAHLLELSWYSYRHRQKRNWNYVK
jgi:hypothetical protein